MKNIDTKEILNIIPENLKRFIGELIQSPDLQEIRIRANKPLIVQLGRKEIILFMLLKRKLNRVI